MDYPAFRKKMVETQLVPRGIADRRVLGAFLAVPRHEFVAPELRDSAYMDHPLPIGEDQTISQPYMVALMTQCLGLTGKEKVLEIGTGSGYQAAILSLLARRVYTIERIKTLAEKAEETLKRLAYENVTVGTGDGTLGWQEHAPYDGIIVTAAAPKIPDAYLEQLAVGGKLVIPEGSIYTQTLTVVGKRREGIFHSNICGCVFVPLIGKEGWKK